MAFWNKKSIKSDNPNTTFNNNSTFMPLSLQWLMDGISGTPTSWYLKNPILNSVINRRSTCLTNVEFKVVNINSNREIKNDPLIEKLEHPNEFQSRDEFLRSLCIFASTYGQAYITGISDSIGFEHSLDNGSLFSLMPEAMTITQIRKGAFKYDYKITYSDFGSAIPISFDNCYPVFDITTGVTQMGFVSNLTGYMTGVSRCNSIKQNIQTLNKAFEARGLISQTPGGLWLVGEQKSDTPGFGLGSKEQESLQKNLSEKYGISKEKAQLIAIAAAISATKLSIPYDELGLDKIIDGEINIILNVFNMNKKIANLGSDNALTPDSLTAIMVNYYQDEIIPLANNIADTITDFYGYRQKGKKLICSFNHLPIFQENLAKKALMVSQVANSVGKLVGVIDNNEIRQILIDLNILKDGSNI